MKKRILSILLTLCMVLTLLPTTVFAAGSDNKNIMLGTSQIEGGQASSVYFGNYRQSSDGSGSYNADPVKWRVLANDENSSGKLLLLADQNLDVKPYNSSYTSITWEKSTIRSWLNGYGANENNYGTDYSSDNFIDTAFSSNEQSAIAETHVYNATQSDGSSNPNPSYSTSGGNNTTDKIFLLSIEEANNSSYFPNGDSARVSTNTAYVAGHSGMYGVGVADYWWLRSPGDSAFRAVRVRDNGGVLITGSIVNSTAGAVRPAFNLNLNSVLFTSAAEGGKADTAVDGDLTAVSDYTGSEWKLTLLDSSRSFSANISGQTSVSAPAGSSIQISYSGAKIGTNEYVSVLLCDSSDTVLYYGNIAQNSAGGTQSVTIPEGLAAGNYKLKVFSEQCNGDKMTDYASGLQEIALEVVLPKETTPNATFTATGDNDGTLSNVDTSMKYSVDGGTTWNAVTGTTMDISSVTAEKDVKVYKPGNGTTTVDSEVQTIDVTQAVQPTGVDKADCTTSQQNDGQITGVDTTMEYRLSGTSGWTAVTVNPVTGLGSGSYEVRVKASGTVLASGTVIVTIGAHTCVAQGDWQHDGTGHWKLCACGAKIEEAAHSGDTASYFEKAACDYCHTEYGNLLTDTTAPTGEIAVDTNKWNSFLNTITFGIFFKDTQSVTVTASDDSYTHDGYTDDKAVKIEYYLHSGDTALTESDLASATFTAYTDKFSINPDNKYVIYARLTDFAGNVTYISSDGIVLDATAPVIKGLENGKTYCEAQTVTVTEKYIESVKVNGTEVTLDASNQFTLNPAEGTQTIVVTDKAGNQTSVSVTVNDGHTYGEWQSNGNNTHTHYCTVTGCDGYEDGDCDGGEATCISKAVCDTCGEEYGELDSANHALENIPAKDATVTATGNKEYWHCKDCKKYFSDAAGTNEIKLDDTIISKLSPEIIEGKGQSITAGEKKELTFKSNAAFSDFIRVELDGKTLDEKYYTVKEGSTVVTLKADYVATLSAGEHTIGIVSESGTASTTFTVNAKTVVDNDTKSPQTGDNSHMALWIALLAASVFGLAGTAVYSKRKRVR
ncbi:DUF6273 domain-containing protein [Lachnospiraceae bacterium LCP19S3_B12]